MKPLKLYYPCRPFRVLQGFGENVEYYLKNLGMAGGHNGLDLFAPDGTPVYATHDGIVVMTGADGKGGQTILVRTLEPFDYKDTQSYYQTVYIHMQAGSFKVKPNDRVYVGQVLALADSTGFSTGSHLHFGLKAVVKSSDGLWDTQDYDNGHKGAIDPAPYFIGQYAEDFSKGWLSTKLEELLTLLKRKRV